MPSFFEKHTTSPSPLIPLLQPILLAHIQNEIHLVPKMLLCYLLYDIFPKIQATPYMILVLFSFRLPFRFITFQERFFCLDTGQNPGIGSADT